MLPHPENDLGLQMTDGDHEFLSVLRWNNSLVLSDVLDAFSLSAELSHQVDIIRSRIKLSGISDHILDTKLSPRGVSVLLELGIIHSQDLDFFAHAYQRKLFHFSLSHFICELGEGKYFSDFLARAETSFNISPTYVMEHIFPLLKPALRQVRPSHRQETLFDPKKRLYLIQAISRSYEHIDPEDRENLEWTELQHSIFPVFLQEIIHGLKKEIEENCLQSLIASNRELFQTIRFKREQGASKDEELLIVFDDLEHAGTACGEEDPFGLFEEVDWCEESDEEQD